jgi:hypothetical protein
MHNCSQQSQWLQDALELEGRLGHFSSPVISSRLPLIENANIPLCIFCGVRRYNTLANCRRILVTYAFKLRLLQRKFSWAWARRSEQALCCWAVHFRPLLHNNHTCRPYRDKKARPLHSPSSPCLSVAPVGSSEMLITEHVTTIRKTAGSEMAGSVYSRTFPWYKLLRTQILSGLAGNTQEHYSCPPRA